MIANLDRARDLMESCEVDALVATTPDNVLYLTGYEGWFERRNSEDMLDPLSRAIQFPSYAVLTKSDRPALIVVASFGATAAGLGAIDVQHFGRPVGSPDTKSAPSAIEVLVQVLKQRGLVDCRIGIELRAPASDRAADLGARLPLARLDDCSVLLRYIRAVKTADEIRLMRECAEASQQAAVTALALARPGRDMLDISTAYRVEVARYDAELDHFAWGVSDGGIAMQVSSALKETDLCYVDFGCRRRGYFSDAGLTLAMREPRADALAAIDNLVRSLDAGSAALQAGRPASACQVEMTRALHTGSASEHCSASGHGLGVQVRDLPFVAPRTTERLRDQCVDLPADLPLEAGMVINLEASVFVAGEYSANVERSYVVRQHGAELLVSAPPAVLMPGAQGRTP
ncbi:aminopeptidase P family protein [bacterium]|nr:MAG: aminopeptidase P family protein [bacterium]